MTACRCCNVKLCQEMDSSVDVKVYEESFFSHQTHINAGKLPWMNKKHQ